MQQTKFHTLMNASLPKKKKSTLIVISPYVKVTKFYIKIYSVDNDKEIYVVDHVSSTSNPMCISACMCACACACMCF